MNGVLSNKWSFSGKAFTLELGDIAPGQSHKILLTVRFKNDAGGKTYVNYATGEGDNGNAIGKSPEVEIISSVADLITDIHYQLYNGYDENMWRPADRISLQEACIVAISSDFQRREHVAGPWHGDGAGLRVQHPRRRNI